MICVVDGCANKRTYRELCRTHYSQRRRETLPPCSVKACNRRAECKGLCFTHRRHQLAGKPLAAVGKYRPDATARDALGRKECATCREWLEASAFRESPRRTDGLTDSCSECLRVYFREHKWRKWYNLQPSDIAGMLSAQGSLCAICPRTLTVETLAVDHDHACCPGKRSCGKCVRGLLCSNCNTGIGLLQDDPTILRKAAEYVSVQLLRYAT